LPEKALRRAEGKVHDSQERTKGGALFRFVPIVPTGPVFCPQTGLAEGDFQGK
jgi:hypothetical protein